MNDEYEINKRIRLLRDAIKLGRQAFAEKTGIKKQTLENIERELQKVNGEQLKAVGTTFPEYKYWLAWGEVLPEAGQISPEIEETRQNLQTGT
jgi:transcriptional regulator with XRE-family HTH domain